MSAAGSCCSAGPGWVAAAGRTGVRRAAVAVLPHLRAAGVCCRMLLVMYSAASHLPGLQLMPGVAGDPSSSPLVPATQPWRPGLGTQQGCSLCRRGVPGVRGCTPKPPTAAVDWTPAWGRKYGLMKDCFLGFPGFLLLLRQGMALD
jgi:hypothetical protein